MGETEALLKIAEAIEMLAYTVGGLVTVAWLTFIFKSQSPNSSIEKLTDVLREWMNRR